MSRWVIIGILPLQNPIDKITTVNSKFCKRNEKTYDTIQSIKVITTLQFLPDRLDVQKFPRFLLNSILDSEDMEITMSTDGACAHDGTEKGDFAFDCGEERGFGGFGGGRGWGNGGCGRMF